MAKIIVPFKRTTAVAQKRDQIRHIHFALLYVLSLIFAVFFILKLINEIKKKTQNIKKYKVREPVWIFFFCLFFLENLV